MSGCYGEATNVGTQSPLQILVVAALTGACQLSGNYESNLLLE